MGCDIHMYMEKKVGGIWASADPMVTLFDWDEKPYRGVPSQHSVYQGGRNYILFSVLAGVRSHYTVEQKFEVKGFPKDASPNVRAIYERWGSDAHTPSYLTLKDLKSVDWDKEWFPLYYRVTKRQREFYKFLLQRRLNQKGKFVQGAWVSEIKPPYVMDFWLHEIVKEPWTNTLMELYTSDVAKEEGKVWTGGVEETEEIMFPTPISIACEDFYRSVVQNKLEDFEPKVSPEDIRLVFWFDN
jgi:hypothetical protein